MESLGRPNVFYDPASTHRWADLNETVFIERVLGELEALMGEAFADYTFVIFSARDGKVSPASAAEHGAHKVLIALSDESGTVPANLQQHYHAIFKCYLESEFPGTNIFPFSLGYVRGVDAHPVKPVDDRSLTAFFSGNLSESRLPLYRALQPVYRRLPPALLRRVYLASGRRSGGRLLPEELSDAIPGSHVRFTRGFKEGLSAADYARLLADSKLALCPKGASRAETFRHIEAMRAGTVIVSEPLPRTHFYRGAPIVTIDDWGEGIARVRRLLADPARLRELQDETTAWWENVCSEPATARYVQACLTKLAA